jgi:hypothetical protein
MLIWGRPFSNSRHFGTPSPELPCLKIAGSRAQRKHVDAARLRDGDPAIPSSFAFWTMLKCERTIQNLPLEEERTDSPAYSHAGSGSRPPCAIWKGLHRVFFCVVNFGMPLSNCNMLLGQRWCRKAPVRRCSWGWEASYTSMQSSPEHLRGSVEIRMSRLLRGHLRHVACHRCGSSVPEQGSGRCHTRTP